MSGPPVYRAVPTAPARSGGIALGRLAGAPVRLQPSALIFAGLVALAYGPALSAAGDRSAVAGYLVAVSFVVLLFVSVLLHECGHALAARRCGVGVRGITLELLGGYTELDRPAPRPGVEVAVAAAGPAG
ncbi:MAG TPA: site-2 protease family protein [Pilimelia sp.]|nr:site-2 protease family protein [Pilimelia sp.]